jgi:hypothetical protein
MKNNIVIGAVLFIISLTNSAAQERAANASVTQSFEKTFNGASNPRWEACAKQISLVQFRYLDKPWLAFFDRTGKLITSGRKVEVHELPLLVKNGMYQAKETSEKKYGAFTIGRIHEMVTGGLTEYYIPFRNTKVHLMISVRTNGGVVIMSRKKVSEDPKSPKNVIARND